MNETQIRQKVVDTAKKYLGYKESNGSHKKIIDIYNGYKPLAQGYKVRYKDEWCATTVSAISILCGLTDIMPTECSCNRMIELYKKLGRWKESDSYVPSIGDIIMYDWQDNGKGDNKGYPDHVGIVTNVSGNTITVIEGNKNNAVGYRTLKVNGKNIRGYCLPDYASKASKTNSDVSVDVAKLFSKSIVGTYRTTTNLNLRTGAGKDNKKQKIQCVIPKGDKVICHGYYSLANKTKWYLVEYKSYTGFVSSKYLKK